MGLLHWEDRYSVGIAAVDHEGLVRAFRQGSLKVLARAGGKVGSAEFAVLPKPPVAMAVSTDLRTLVPGGMTTVSVCAIVLLDSRVPTVSHNHCFAGQCVARIALG